MSTQSGNHSYAHLLDVGNLVCCCSYNQIQNIGKRELLKKQYKAKNSLKSSYSYILFKNLKSFDRIRYALKELDI